MSFIDWVTLLSSVATILGFFFSFGVSKKQIGEAYNDQIGKPSVGESTGLSHKARVVIKTVSRPKRLANFLLYVLSLQWRRFSRTLKLFAVISIFGAATIAGSFIYEEYFSRPWIQVWSDSSALAQHPFARSCVDVTKGYKLVGGGARVSQSSTDNLLTASFPDDNCWIAMSKDHRQKSPASITAYAIGLYDPDNKWEVYYVRSEGRFGDNPTAEASLPKGYWLTGGGGRTHWSTSGSRNAGNLLTVSRPASESTWLVEARFREDENPTEAVAYVIGIKRNTGNPPASITDYECKDGKLENRPQSVAKPKQGFVLIGGGASVKSQDAGNFLAESFPSDDGWLAVAKRHLMPSKGIVTACQISINTAALD